MIANTPEAWSERAALPTSHEAALWSAEGQQERFRSVLAELDPQPGETLLDFGCGTGALSAFLQEDVGYFGCDWSEAMLERAYHDHPAAAFGRYLPLRHFELIACIGTFNLRDGWSKELTWATIRLLWKMTDRALAACLYAGGDPDCLVYTAAELEQFDHGGISIPYVERHRPNDLLFVLRR